MSSLRSAIDAEILEHGSIGLDRYMELCLSHPQYGYYMKQQPFGSKGDFTTSPEISQMFGELIGLWLVHMWNEIGAPERFALVELGPGRGTLMADLLRAAQVQPSFLEAAEIFLLESSEKLRQEQIKKLDGFSITHINNLQSLPEIPILLVANEFFDALPVQQWVKNDFGWQERRIATGLKIAHTKTIPQPELDKRYPKLATGQIVEINKAAVAISNVITKRLTRLGGAALIIDYGEFDGVGDTFQAVQNHKKTDPFESPGEADLTAHVKFCDLVQGGVNQNFTTQGSFLEQLGINARREALEKTARKSLRTEQNRLVSDDEMGRLFKVLALSSCNLQNAPGFG